MLTNLSSVNNRRQENECNMAISLNLTNCSSKLKCEHKTVSLSRVNNSTSYYKGHC